jgi:release factor glutamine methyltransferase
MGVEMIAGPAALIPRKETEILGNAALEKLGELAVERQTPLVLDVCTGSGNLALALAYHQQDCLVFGSDLCPHAVELATKNAHHLGLNDRVNFLVGDLLDPFDHDEFVGKVDIIVCNPPYISSSKMQHMPAEVIEHEPELAFNGGPFGISIILRLISGAPRLLKPDSWLCFEVGLGQGALVRSRIEKNGSYREIHSRTDHQGNVRAILARTV